MRGRQAALATLILALAGAPAARAETPALAAELGSLREAIRASGARWEAGETPLSGLTPEQMRGYLGALETPPEVRAKLPKFSPPAAPLALPAGFDWRSRGGGSYVTAVRDQAGCGSCWAFATTAALEARALITFARPGEAFDLSEQTLVSCSGAGSCAGGYLGQSAAFLESKGLPVESCYPYEAANGSCARACADRSRSSYRLDSYLAVAQSVADLKAALVQHGPVPLGMRVYGDFQSYRAGVYSHVSGYYLGGHAVALVGYDDAASCFIVKNSWGDGWGEGGFFRIAYAEVAGATAFGRDALAYGPAISPFDPASLGEAVDNTALAWSTALVDGWFAQGAVSTHGGDALRSGPVSTYGKTWVETSVAGPAEVSFDQQVSSNDGVLTLAVDGEDVDRLDYRTTGWQHASMPLGPGTHRLRWSYRPGWSSPDAAWLDHVVVGPASEEVTAPGVPTGSAGAGIVGGLYAFGASGAVSAAGHVVEYRFDWGDGTRSAWSTRGAAEHAWSASGTYRVRAQARCASHPSLRTAWSPPLDIGIAPPLPITLARAVDAPGLTFESGGDAAWFAQNATAYGGGAAAQSGHISDPYGDGESWIRTTVTGPGGLGFLWRLSASSRTDLLVTLDGVTQLSTSGVRPWERRIVPIGGGTHVVTWRYLQDSADAATSDAAWLDQVEFLPDFESIPAPAVPSGSRAATDGVPSAYAAAPVVSNQGHTVEYRFDWGDGSLSDWSASPGAAHAWAGTGYRGVKVQARCAAHPELVTAWSDTLSVTVSPFESVAVPGVPAGPAAGLEEMVATFASTLDDPTAPHGRMVRFDWGDGTISEWVSAAGGPVRAGHRWAAAGTYLVRAQARCVSHVELASAWSEAATVAIAPRPAIALGTALDAAALTWTTGGDAGWFGQETDAVSGGTSAQSGAVAAGQTSWIQTTVTGPANVSFHWRELAGDYGWLALYVDGVRPVDFYCDASWGFKVLSVAAGQHTLRWVFTKSFEGLSGEDCGRLDQVTVVASSETVGRAGMVGGPASGTPGIAYDFSASGASSNLGHALQYRFAWGDGTLTDWSANAAASRSWAAPAVYQVQAQARCATHPGIVSEWSYQKSVWITTLPPAAPTGPAAGVDNAAYTYTTAGVASDPGVPLEYQFDWGDSQYSPWSALTAAERSWYYTGTYQVRARARLAGNYQSVSAWSEPLTVTIGPYEVITQPTLSGPATGVVRTPYTYVAEGAASSLGHPLSYHFQAGYTGWTIAEPAWETEFTSAGAYAVKVTARCAQHRRYEAASAPLPVTIAWPAEAVSAPVVPAGPARLTRGEVGRYASGGSTSSLGHEVHYDFDWGDGSSPYFSSGSQGVHIWSKAGVYQVRVRAACALDGGTISAWSPALAVTVVDPPETVSTPSPPQGPSHSLIVGDTGVYTTGDAVSSLGHPLEYRFEFFGAATTEWSSLPLVARTWTSGFSGSVKAQARCAQHPEMVSAWSQPLWTRVSQETIALPGTPGGPDSGSSGRVYVFRVSDPAPLSGHDREYRFDWGDGTLSDWLADPSRAHAWAAPGRYAVRLKARCALHTGVESSWSLTLPVVIRPPNDLAAAVDAGDLIVETGGDAVWQGETEQGAFDQDAAGSGAVGDSQSTWMRSFVEGPGEVRFSWRVSSAAGDALILYLDGAEQFRISGEVPWENRIVSLSGGRHSLLWLYRRDAAGSAGEDRGWVDRVEVSSQADSVAAPAAPTGPESGVTQTAYAFGTTGGLSGKGHPLEHRFAWGDGALSPWSSSPAAAHAWGAPGTYAVAAQARCQMEPGRVSEFSPPTAVSIALLVENVGTPAAPSGTSNCEAGDIVPFGAGGSVSDLGHQVEYRFDWGDGALSSWSGDAVRTHAWIAPGVFEVRAQARCARHAAMESGWSETFLVAVAPTTEMIALPAAPAGPRGAKTGSEAVFTLDEATSNVGHALEYRVDWGDGAVSAWEAATGATHAWAAAGTYFVTAQARCAAHPDLESAWSPAGEIAVSDHHDLGAAVDNTALIWETGGDAVWGPLKLKGAAGGDAARSAPLAAARSSWIETVVEGPTSLYFLWRVASEAGKDRLVFRLDGVEQRRIAGTTPWLFGSARVEAGSHRLQWRFTRGSRLATVPHNAWLDLVVADPREIAGAIAVLRPAGGETFGRGQTVTLRWSRTGTIGPAVAVQLLRRTPAGAWDARTLAPALPDTGSWSWKIPASLVPGARYRIRVVSCAGPAIRGTSSGSFTVR